MVWILPLLFFGCGGSTADRSAVQAELLKNVDEIRQAQIDLLVIGEFTPCSNEAEAKTAATPTVRTWTGEKCWADIGWKPDADVFGGYWVVVEDGAFTAHGISPELDDKSRIHVTATQQKSAQVKP
tara:strand:- start:159 stop:536 length:378 start_codon:yes stop_codon:yes gene_type:complete